MSDVNKPSDNLIKEDEGCLLQVLKAFCCEEYDSIHLSSKQWDMLLGKSIAHSVASFVNEVAMESESVPKSTADGLKMEASKTVLSNYRFFAMAGNIQNSLRDNHINSVIIKGMATASFYRVPELRKSGDIDILLTCREDLLKAEKVLSDKGFTKDKEQNGSHHLVMTYDNISVEIHTLFSEEFDDRFINQYQSGLMKEINEHTVYVDCMGYKVQTLSDAYHGYELIIHMLQHFLREGFGLRLICDWYMFWNREIENCQKDEYLKLVKGSGVKTFSDVITQITIDYLGLSEEKVSWMQINKELNSEKYLADILDSGEFGILENDRMVALKDDSLWEYIRVFHNQMHHNYPRAGKIFIIWPVLWIATFIRFLRNNKKIRNNNGMAYLKKAKSRSLLVKELNLFKQV